MIKKMKMIKKMRKMKKRVLSLLLCLCMVLMLLPTVTLAEGNTYTVVGDAGLCGDDWNTDKNPMTFGSYTYEDTSYDYAITFSSVNSAEDGYKFVVAKNGNYENAWPAGDNYQLSFPESESQTLYDVTIYFDSATGKIGVCKQKLGQTALTLTVFGNGSGAWLNGALNDATNASNDMVESNPGSGMYTLTFDNVAAGENYAFKIAIDHSDKNYWGKDGLKGTSYEFSTSETGYVTIYFDSITKQISVDLEHPKQYKQTLTKQWKDMKENSKQYKRTLTLYGMGDGAWLNDAFYDENDTRNDMVETTPGSGIYTKTYTGIAAHNYGFRVAMDHSTDIVWGNYGIYNNDIFPIKVMGDNATVTITVDISKVDFENLDKTPATITWTCDTNSPIVISDITVSDDVIVGYEAGSVTARVNVSAQDPDAVITYKWYKKNGDTDTLVFTSTDSSCYNLPTGLGVGEHTYYCVVSADNDSYTSDTVSVMVETAVASVSAKGMSTSYYSTLARAEEVANIGTGRTVTLLKDVILPNTLSDDSMKFTKADTVLDLNGHTITVTDGARYSGAVVTVSDPGELTIQDSSNEKTGAINNPNGLMAVRCYDERLTITGGSYTAKGLKWNGADQAYTVGGAVFSNGNNLTITGGTFSATETGCYAVGCNVYKLTITGGNFIDGLFMNCYAGMLGSDNDHSSHITGGSFGKIRVASGAHEGPDQGYYMLQDVISKGYGLIRTADDTCIGDLSMAVIEDSVNVQKFGLYISTPLKASTESMMSDYTTAPVLTITATPFTATDTITYTWYQNGTQVAVTNSGSYTPKERLAPGSYTYYCVVTASSTPLYWVKSGSVTVQVLQVIADVIGADGKKIGNYTSIYDAIQKASENEGSTLKLLNSFSSGEFGTSLGKFTIDLAGHTWTVSGDSALCIENSYYHSPPEIILTDSVGGGKISGASQTSFLVNDAKLTIHGGTYDGNVSAIESILIIDGGSFLQNVNIEDAVETKISGGTFAGLHFLNGAAIGQLSGGTFGMLQIDNGKLGDVLGAGYGCKYTAADSGWVTDPTVKNITAQFSVKKNPMTISAANADKTSIMEGYAPADAPVVTATATVGLGDGEASIIYQWYEEKGSIDTAIGGNSSTCVLEGLTYGEHTFYCVATYEEYSVTSASVTVTVTGVVELCYTNVDGVNVSATYPTVMDASNDLPVDYSNSEIKLLGNVTQTGQHDSPIFNKSLRLDLNGYTLDMGNHSLILNNGGTILGNGAITSKNMNGAIICHSGTLTVENGTFRAEQYFALCLALDSNAIIQDGSFTGICMDYDSTGSLKINGGVFTGTGNNAAALDIRTGCTATIQLNGGTFTPSKTGFAVNDRRTLAKVTALLGDGLCYYKGTDATKENGVVASVSGNTIAEMVTVGGAPLASVTAKDGALIGNYESFADALAAAQTAEGSTLRLGQNISTTETINIASGKFTFDLNGKTWSSTASDAALKITNGDVTLADSTTDGKLTTNGALCVRTTSDSEAVTPKLTITGGIYESTSECNVIGYRSKITINGGTFTKNVKGSNLTLNIDGGNFQSVVMDDSSVTISGGSYGSLIIADGKTLADALEMGYAYRSTESGSAWISDAYVTQLQNVTVEQIPVSITAQSESLAELTYGYNGGPQLYVTAVSIPADSYKDILYKWYRGTVSNENLVGIKSTYTVPSGLTVGSNTYICTVTCDGYTLTSDLITVTVNKAMPDLGTVSLADTKTILYPNTDLSSIALKRLYETVDGTLKLDAGQILTVGTVDYDWTFTPADSINYQTKSGKISLTVIADTLQSISIGSTTPIKKEYIYGDAFEIAGLTVTATYASGVSKNVTADVTFGTLSGGDTSITLSYTEDSITKTCEVANLTVNKQQLNVSSMSWSDGSYTYTGKAQGVTLNGTLPTGVTVIKTDDTATNKGTYTAMATFALADGYDTKNYEITGTNPLKKEWSIAPAPLTGTKNFEKSLRYTILAEQMLTAADFGIFMEGTFAVNGAVTDRGSVLKTMPTYDTTVKYQLKSGLSFAKQTVSIPVTFTPADTNYASVHLTATITLTDSNTINMPDRNTITLNLAASKTNGIVYGDSVTYTASLNNDHAFLDEMDKLDGNIKFYLGNPNLEGTLLDTQTINGSDPIASVTLNFDKLTAGTHTIYAVYGGNAVFKNTTTSTTTVVAAKVLTWDVSGLSALKKADGTTTATVNGSLLVVGAFKGTDPRFTYTSLGGEYSSAEAGSHTVIVSIKDAKVSNGNYVLTTESPTFTGIIKDVRILTPPFSENGKVYRLEQEYGISEVPATLQSKTNLNTPAKIETQMKLSVTKANRNISANNIKVYDITLKFSTDGEKTWTVADEANLPAGGIPVVLPYPAGTSKSGFDFVITHMFTTGAKAGTIETITSEKTEDGLKFVLHSLSPVAVGYQAVTPSDNNDSNAPTESVETDPKTDDNGSNAPTESVETNPKTGDNSHMVLFAFLILFSGSGIAIIMTKKRKQRS